MRLAHVRWAAADRKAEPIIISFIVIVRLRFKFSAHDCRASARDFVANGGRNLPRLGMIGMAMVDSVHLADDGYELVTTQLRLNGALSLRPKLLTVSVITLAMGLAGCARDPAHREFNPVQREVRAKPVRLSSRAHAEPRQSVELRVRRPDPALLAPQPTPDCEFKRADIKAMDPDEWARLKVEYERQCYQDAEKAARDRLSQLQASGVCEIERIPATAARSTTNAHSRPKS